MGAAPVGNPETEPHYAAAEGAAANKAVELRPSGDGKFTTLAFPDARIEVDGDAKRIVVRGLTLDDFAGSKAGNAAALVARMEAFARENGLEIGLAGDGVVEAWEGMRRQIAAEAETAFARRQGEERRRAVLDRLKASGLASDVVESAGEFNRLFQELSGEALKSGEEVYGFVDPKTKKIYLNPEFFGGELGLETPIHEFGHLGVIAAEKVNKPVYDRGMSLAKGFLENPETAGDGAVREIVDFILGDRVYSGQGRDVQAQELLAQLIGKRGEEALRNETNKTVVEKIKSWLVEFWNTFGKALGLKDITPEEAAKMTVEDVADAIRAEMLSGRKYGSALTGGGENGKLSNVTQNRPTAVERGHETGELKHPHFTKEEAAASTARIAAEIDTADKTELSGIIKIAKALAEKDRKTTNALQSRHFKFAKTGEELKQIGLDGEYFTIRAGVILRHNGKDAAHTITPQEWIGISEALSNRKPILVEKRGDDGRSFRIWTRAMIGGRIAIVGAEVKSAGRELKVNSIKTAFGAEGAAPKIENIIYPKSREELQSVLIRHDSGRYTVALPAEIAKGDFGGIVANGAENVNPRSFDGSPSGNGEGSKYAVGFGGVEFAEGGARTATRPVRVKRRLTGRQKAVNDFVAKMGGAEDPANTETDMLSLWVDNGGRLFDKMPFEVSTGYSKGKTGVKKTRSAVADEFAESTAFYKDLNPAQRKVFFGTEKLESGSIGESLREKLEAAGITRFTREDGTVDYEAAIEEFQRQWTNYERGAEFLKERGEYEEARDRAIVEEMERAEAAEREAERAAMDEISAEEAAARDEAAKSGMMFSRKTVGNQEIAIADDLDAMEKINPRDPRSVERYILDNLEDNIRMLAGGDASITAESAKHYAWSKVRGFDGRQMRQARAKAATVIRDLIEMFTANGRTQEPAKPGKNGVAWRCRLPIAVPRLDSSRNVVGAIGYDADVIIKDEGNGKFFYDVSHLKKNGTLTGKLDKQKNILFGSQGTALPPSQAGSASGVPTDGIIANPSEGEQGGRKLLFSRATLKNGRDYVHVDVEQKQFDGKTPIEQQKIAKRAILKKFRNKVIGEGDNKAWVDKASAGEYVHPVKRLNDQAYSAKMRTSTELDNLMATAKFKGHNPDDGRHPKAKGGWDHYEAIFEVGGRYYTGDVALMVDARGRRRLHDVTQIKEETLSQLTGSTQGHSAAPGISAREVLQGQNPDAGSSTGGIIPQTAAGAQGGRKLLFSIGGRSGAKNLGIGKMDEAEAMEKSGADRKDIWRKTGWWRGKDGKWRVELPDVRRGKWHGDPEERHFRGGGEDFYRYNLTELIEDGDFLKAYPQARKIKIEFHKNMPENVGGNFNEQTLTIKLPQKYQILTDYAKAGLGEGKAASLNEAGRKSIVHELQHAIQLFESFAKGGSPTEPVRHYALDGNTGHALSVFSESIGMNPTNRKHLAIIANWAQKITSDYTRDDVPKRLVEKFEAAAKEAGKTPQEFRDEIERFYDSHTETPMGQYYKLEGEVEARNAQARLGMTAEERAATPPWETEDVPESRQVLRFSRASSKLGEEIPERAEKYSYAALTSLPNIKIAKFKDAAFSPKATLKDMIAVGRKSVLAAGGRHTNRGDTLTIPALGRDVIVGKPGIMHGLRPYGNYKDVYTKENADILPVLGDVLKNAVPVNELKPREKNPEIVRNTVLISACQDESGNIVPVVGIVQHAKDTDYTPPVYVYPLKGINTNGRSPNAFDTHTGLSGQTSISIANLIEKAKGLTPVFSKDVYAHFNENRPESDYKGLMYSRGTRPEAKYVKLTRVADDAGAGERATGPLAASVELSRTAPTPLTTRGTRYVSLPVSEMHALLRFLGGHAEMVEGSKLGAAGNASVKRRKLQIAADLVGTVDKSDLAAEKAQLRQRGYFANEDPTWLATHSQAEARAERERGETALASRLEALSDRRVRGAEPGGMAAGRRVFADQLAKIVMAMPHGQPGVLGAMQTVGGALEKRVRGNDAEAEAFLDWMQGGPAQTARSAQERKAGMFAAFLTMPKEMEARARGWYDAIRSTIAGDAKLADAFRMVTVRSMSAEAHAHLEAELRKAMEAQTEAAIAKLRAEADEPIKAGGAADAARETVVLACDDRMGAAMVRVNAATRNYLAAQKKLMAAAKTPADKAAIKQQTDMFIGAIAQAKNQVEISRTAWERGHNNADARYLWRMVDLLNEATVRDGLKTGDLSLYLDQMRVIETKGLSGARGESARQAQLVLDAMKRRLGAADFAKVEAFAQKFHAIHEQELVNDPVLERVMGKATADYWRSQSHYVTTKRQFSPEELQESAVKRGLRFVFPGLAPTTEIAMTHLVRHMPEKMSLPLRRIWGEHTALFYAPKAKRMAMWLTDHNEMQKRLWEAEPSVRAEPLPRAGKSCHSYSQTQTPVQGRPHIPSMRTKASMYVTHCNM